MGALPATNHRNRTQTSGWKTTVMSSKKNNPSTKNSDGLEKTRICVDDEVRGKRSKYAHYTPKKTTTTQEDSERGDQAFHAFVMCFEGIFAEDGSLGLVIQF